jgi:hypothetical protein
LPTGEKVSLGGWGPVRPSSEEEEEEDEEEELEDELLLSMIANIRILIQTLTFATIL